MTVLKAIILGLIQGLTEFFPVSSSGHLVLFEKLFDLAPNVTFDLFLHLGTLASVVAVYFKDVLEIFRHPIKIWYLVLATLPAVIVILILRKTIEQFFSGGYLCFAFLITAIALFASEKVSEHRQKLGFECSPEINSRTALFMGAAQAVAVIPGISRSGMTISAGLYQNVRREEVTSFSFLMSIPIILGSALVSVFECSFLELALMPTIFGVLTSFGSGFFAILLMKKLVKNAKLKWFSIYLLFASVFSFFVFYGQ